MGPEVLKARTERPAAAAPAMILTTAPWQRIAFRLATNTRTAHVLEPQWLETYCNYWKELKDESHHTVSFVFTYKTKLFLFTFCKRLLLKCDAPETL